MDEYSDIILGSYLVHKRLIPYKVLTCSFATNFDLYKIIYGEITDFEDRLHSSNL